MSTLTQLRTAVAEEIGMNATDDATKLTRWLNDAVRDVSMETAVNVDKAEMDLTADQSDYTLSTSTLRILKVYTSDVSQSRQLERLSLDELIDRQSLESDASFPTKYYAVRGRSIFLYPTPGSGEKLLIVYTPRPTELSADSDDPSTIALGGIPVEHHVALEFYACWRAGRFDDDTSSQMGIQYLADYQRELVKMKRNLRRNGGDRNPRLHVNTRRNRRQVPHDNSSTAGSF